ncbi:MAG: phosphoglycerate mutase [Planctomycetes bacterium RBG_16_64_10]|nr:MAG: phosphoglycerate mutase [Planctomycetes bacterium RBG_16_64_10]
MLQILLIRPGSTEYDREGRIQGTLDIPLSEEGRQEVLDVIEQLRGQSIEALYSAPAQAAVETGQAIAESIHLKLKKLDKMHNLDQGLWQGMLVDDVKIRHPKVSRQWQEQPEKVCPPGGEMVSAAQKRVRSVLSRLQKKHKDGVIGLVVPEPLASVVRNVLRRDSLGDLWKASAGDRWEVIPVVPSATVCD